jgi:hypothetical protein
MEKQSKTFKGMMSNLGDAWTGFERRIAESGFFDRAKKNLDTLLQKIDQWDKDGTLQKAAEFIASIFNTVADVIGLVAERIGTHISFINKHWDKFGPILKALAIALGVLVAAAAPIASLFIAAGLALDDFFTYMEGGDSVIGSIIDQFPDMKKGFQAIVEMTKNAWKGFENWWNNIIRLRNEFVDTMSAKISELVDAFKDGIEGIIHFFDYLWERAKKTATEFFVGLQQQFLDLVNAISAKWNEFAAQVREGGAAAIQAVIDKWNEFIEAISHMSKAIYDALVNFGIDMGKAILEGLSQMKDQFVNWFQSLLPEWMGGTAAPASLSGGGGSGTLRGGAGDDLLMNASYGGGGGGGRRGGGQNDNYSGGGAGRTGGGAGGSQGRRRGSGGGGGGGGRGVKISGGRADELATAIRASAKRLQLPAEDLATFMSFETGGTYDPWQKGPRTKWGLHRGLIQWGEQQRRQYGVTENSTITEQVEAAEQYLLDRGFKPGVHTGVNAYAAVNAGNANKTGARDAAAGGTWGTVADKWNYQMGGHRAKARKLLSGGYSGTGSAASAAAPASSLLNNFAVNAGRAAGGVGATAGATINSDRSNTSSNVNVTAPVNVHVQNADQAPDATARAVGNAVSRGAGLSAKPARMQGSSAS